MKHDYYDREDGLLHCKVCNGGEGSLPTDCPGEKMTDERENAVFRGELNYIHGIGWLAVHPRAMHLSDYGSHK